MSLSDGVTVALQILVLPVQVRILVGQQKRYGIGDVIKRSYGTSPIDFLYISQLFMHINR